MPESPNRVVSSFRDRGKGDTSPVSPVERLKGSRVQREKSETSFVKRVLVPIVLATTDTGSILMRNVDLDEVRYRLMRGGFPRNLNARSFMFLKFCGMFIGPVVLYLYMLLLFPLLQVDFIYTYQICTVIFGVIVGLKLPDIWLNSLTRKRTNMIQMELPDLIDLVAISVEAGLGLYAALQRVATRFPGPLSEEILRTLQEIRIGRTRVEAMRDLAKRVDLVDLSVFITALVQSEILGLSVANVLKIQSERLRERRRTRARETAQKAPIKMLLPLVFFIFPALFVVILGPPMIKMIAAGTL